MNERDVDRIVKELDGIARAIGCLVYIFFVIMVFLLVRELSITYGW